MTHVTCWLTAKDRDQLRNPTLGNRVWATFLGYNALLCVLMQFEGQSAELLETREMHQEAHEDNRTLALKMDILEKYAHHTIQQDTGSYFNVRSKADTSELNPPYGTKN